MTVDRRTLRAGAWKWPVPDAKACDDTALLRRCLDGLRRYNPPEQSPPAKAAESVEPGEPQLRKAVRVRPYIDYTPGRETSRAPDPAEPCDSVAAFLAAARSEATS